MPFLKHLTKAEIADNFVYRGWMFGLVPVYVGDMRTGMPTISTRNGIPEFAMDLGEAMFAVYTVLASAFSRDIVETPFPIKLTERLDGKPLEAWL